MAGGLTESERAERAEVDAESPPPPLDSVEAVRARLPDPEAVADARTWADRIRRTTPPRCWESATRPPAGGGSRAARSATTSCGSSQHSGRPSRSTSRRGISGRWP